MELQRHLTKNASLFTDLQRPIAGDDFNREQLGDEFWAGIGLNSDLYSLHGLLRLNALLNRDEEAH